MAAARPVEELAAAAAAAKVVRAGHGPGRPRVCAGGKGETRPSPVEEGHPRLPPSLPSPCPSPPPPVDKVHTSIQTLQMAFFTVVGWRPHVPPASRLRQTLTPHPLPPSHSITPLPNTPHRGSSRPPAKHLPLVSRRKTNMEGKLLIIMMMIQK